MASAATTTPTTLDWQLLTAQDDRTSNAVIAILQDNADFARLSQDEGAAIMLRDAEDDTKLAKGIEFSIARGVLPANVVVEPTTEVDVLGKSADDVANEILASLGGTTGKVLVLQGLSGTGKGTTVAKLQKKLPRCVCWSNGNVFRSVTYLVTEDCKRNGKEFGPDMLTPEQVQAYMKMLSFEAVSGEAYDIVIDCFGTRVLVADICNTSLKEPVIGSRVPTVAEMCQGEVVLFAAGAVSTLQAAGYNVILEGRAQTLNHIRTPYRYTLTFKEPGLLGRRRAAQRVMAAAVAELTAAPTDADRNPEAIAQALAKASATLK